jgi:uncharacterized protein
MNLIRFILFVLVALIIWRFVRQWYQDLRQEQTNNESANNESPEAKAPKILPHGKMVRCDYCGLYLPKEEAISLAEKTYCCEAHKLAAQQEEINN